MIEIKLRLVPIFIAVIHAMFFLSKCLRQIFDKKNWSGFARANRDMIAPGTAIIFAGQVFGVLAIQLNRCTV